MNPPTLRDRASALAHTARSLPPYLGLAALFPGGPVPFRALPVTLKEAYAFHEKLLARPGFRAMLAKLEREDLLTLPAMIAATPLDLLRIRHKFATGTVRLPVEAPDDFPYPDYYLNDFHNQKNGNLSLQSALTYEWQISVLFMGCNRLMRQAVIDHIPAGDDLQILDVACGTAAWIPQARLQGRMHAITAVDLSPAYLRFARYAQALGFRDNARFLQLNAESLQPPGLPADGWSAHFDLVTSIWLLHELPRRAIERSIAEMVRVLKPGGRLLLLDSMQRADIPPERRDRAESVYRFFARYFNEPYYLAYQGLDVPALLQAHGLIVEGTEDWFRSKLWVARKPA
jgi:ubiquinone/menaquinone biosynthesis C-methylase UbiE